MAVKSRVSVDTAFVVNLVPLMAVITMLIPLLVFSFNFYEVKIIPVGAPRMGTGVASKSGDVEEKRALNLTVVISEKGFKVKMDPSLVPADLADVGIEKRTFTNTMGENYEEYDYAKLYSTIVTVKDKFPKENTVNIGAEFGIPMHVIARTIDATRYRLVKDNFDSFSEYAVADRKSDKDHNPVYNFPNIVFVVVD